MKKNSCLGMLLSVVFILTGCSGGQDGPSEDDIAKAMSFELPTGIEVDSVDIVVAENTGSEVEPRYKTRSEVSLKYKQDFYEKTDYLLDKDIVKKVAEKGDVITGMLISTATLSNKKWKVSINKFDAPKFRGKAESKFGSNAFVLENSSEHKKLVEEVQRQEKLAKEKAAKAAAAAKAAKQQRIASFREAIKGTWISSKPTRYKDAFWSNRAGNRMGFLLTFPEGTEDNGEGKFTMFDYDNPFYEIGVDFSFFVNDDDNSVKINLLETTKNERLDFTIYNTTKMTFSKDGTLYIESNSRNKWFVAQMERSPDKVASRNKIVKKYKDAIEKYGPMSGEGGLRRLPLNDNTYGIFIVEAELGGKVIGTNQYSGRSIIETTVIHAGLLKQREIGIIKILKRNQKECVPRVASSRHGVKSRGERSDCNPSYTFELVEKITSQN